MTVINAAVAGMYTLRNTKVTAGNEVSAAGSDHSSVGCSDCNTSIPVLAPPPGAGYTPSVWPLALSTTARPSCPTGLSVTALAVSSDPFFWKRHLVHESVIICVREEGGVLLDRRYPISLPHATGLL